MGKNWIYRATNNLCVDCTELFNSVTEGYDLCWADKCTGNKQKVIIWVKWTIIISFKNLKNGSITLQFQRHLVTENITEDYQHFKLQCILMVQIKSSS